MPDTQPTATVAGQSIALHVTGYPDLPNRWGTGHIRATGIRLDYGNNRTPNGRHAFVTGLWIREDGEPTTDPIDRYYDAPDGDMSDWPDWLAELTRQHTPTVARDAALREAADHFEARAAVIADVSDDPAIFVAKDRWKVAGVWREGATELRRLAAEAQQEPYTEAHPPTHAWKVESPRRDNWASWGATHDERKWAAESLASVVEVAPQRPFRLVRATTTYTVEAEHTPTGTGQGA